MQAIILAAGRGERLKPITDSLAKPLFKVGKLRLIEHHIINLKAAGITHIVINTSHLTEQVVHFLGDGTRYDLSLKYSNEPKGALETGGGIKQALRFLDDEIFIVVNGDIYSSYNFSKLSLSKRYLANLVMVDNPPHNLTGDFKLENGLLSSKENNTKTLTFAGIGIYNQKLFNGNFSKKFPLTVVLEKPMKNGEIAGEYFNGCWVDVGTPKRLAQARRLSPIPR